MNIYYEEIREFKRLDLPEILKSYGIPLKSRNPHSLMALCPFHDDKNPSLSLSKVDDRWLFRCFGCHVSGTVIDFVMKKENLTLPETYAKLKGMLPHTESSSNGNGIHPPNPLELLKLVSDFYRKTFFTDKRAFEYLKSRGIKSPEIYESFKVGFCNGSLKKILSLKSETFQDLKKLGLLNDSGNEFFYNCVVIPLFDDDGNVVSLYGRNISQKRHLYLKGPHKGLVNRQGAFGAEKVILTESILDALSLYELGIRNVVPCYGTGGFTEDHKTLLTKQRTKEIELCFDNDNAGIHGAQALINEYRPSLTGSLVRLPEGIKDLNDFLLAGKTKEDFEKLERLSIETPKSLFSSDTSYEITKDNNSLHIKSGERLYRIILPEFESIHSLRVNIKFQVGIPYDIDVLDFYSERQRKSYTKRIALKFSLPEEALEQDLYRILEEIEKQSATKSSADSSDIKKPMSVEEKDEALGTLKNPNLTQEIIHDLERIGCVGEEKNKLLGYLVTISRKLSDTLSLTIVSQSGAGKSNLADTLEAILPKDEVVRLSRITPQALYYMEKNALKRKVLVIEEKEGSKDSDYSIRVLQSKKSLRLAVAMKDPKDQKMKTVIFEVEGPVVVIETTTRTDINPENGSRVFIAYMDESEEQTKRIHLFQRQQKTIEGRKLKQDSERIIQKHQNIQTLLKETAIDIPYVHEIHFPSKWMRTRRDYQKFLNLIEAVTFLHQYQRQRRTLDDGSEYIESTTQDYKVAYSLACDIFGDCLSELMKPDRDFFERLKTMVGGVVEKTFERREVRDFTGLPDHVVRDRLRVLSEMEYLLVLEGKQGKQYQYKLNPHPIQSKEIISGLTTSEELEESLRRSATRTPADAARSGTSRQLRQNFETKLNGCVAVG